MELLGSGEMAQKSKGFPNEADQLSSISKIDKMEKLN